VREIESSSGRSSNPFSNILATIPSPAPLPGAVEAGVFGRSLGSVEPPTIEEIRALIDEQAREICTLLAGQHYLAWCIKHDCYPQTHRRPSNASRREQLSQRLRQEIEELAEQYRWCVTAYADAFGEDAAMLLDSAVRKFVHDMSPSGSAIVQRRLF